MKPTTITTLAAVVVIGALGFMAGRISSSSSGTSGENYQSAATRSSRAAAESGTGQESPSNRKVRHPDPAERYSAAKGVDRLDRLTTIIRGENSLARTRALLAFVDQLGPGDFEEAVVHFRSLGITESRFGEYVMLLSAWAQADPLAALEFAKVNTGNRFARDTVLATWASIDPDAAIRWAEADHQGEGANPHMAGIIRSLAGQDPVRATQLLTAMPRSTERGEALDAMMPHIMRQGNEAARSWIAEIADDSLRNGAIMRSAEQLAVTDPAGTASWLAANPGEGALRSMDDVYNVWARTDQKAAMTSLATLPSGENRSNALRGVISSVARNDPSAAVTVMDRFPSDVTDRVIQHFVWNSFRTDPSVAVDQIARMTNDSEREQTYRRTMEAWIERDSAAAIAWMQKNPLPPSVQERINRRLNEQSQ